MAQSVVALVGRPNVGKSTLFNKLIGQRLSIVEDTPGVTRDRIFARCEWSGHQFMLADTGGIEPYSDDIILSQMRHQAQLAIEQADVIVLVTDIKSGVTANDMDVATMLQKSGKPIILCVNKVDNVGTCRRVLRFLIGLETRLLYPRFTDTGRATCWMLSAGFYPKGRTIRRRLKSSRLRL